MYSVIFRMRQYIECHKGDKQTIRNLEEMYENRVNEYLKISDMLNKTKNKEDKS